MLYLVKLKVICSLILVLANLSFAANCGLQKKESFRIFVSFSMPRELLASLDQQAKQIGAKLVIQGLKNNSFKETFAFAKSLGDQGIRFDIDPKAFEDFEVTQVPAFVINQGNQYDKIVGNVSIAYALNEFANKGDLKDKAKEYLMRLENEKK